MKKELFSSPTIKTQKYTQSEDPIFRKIAIDSPLAKTTERGSKSSYSEQNKSVASRYIKQPA